MLLRYLTVTFLQWTHERHLIARPWGRDMGCLCELAVWLKYYILAFTLCAISYHVGPRDIESPKYQGFVARGSLHGNIITSSIHQQRIFLLHNNHKHNSVAINRIETLWRIYASINQAIIFSEDYLSPAWHRAMTWTDAGLLSPALSEGKRGYNGSVSVRPSVLSSGPNFGKAITQQPLVRFSPN